MEKKMRMKSRLKYLDCFLRASSVPLNIATVCLTSTNRQDNLSYGPIRFSNFLALRYMACVSFISAAYALASSFASWVEAVAARAWLFFIPDQIVAYLMVISTAAVTNFLYLAYHGDRDVTWSEACSSYTAFCDRTRLALVLHFISLFCFFTLAVISAYRTFSDFNPPYVPTKEPDEE
ncbi:hypothetical protein MLD38_000544 [Melastoma candidum]|uniref:Uncharacterized protein n=1 Tax=Melastoma candidum TaxID=119954 RepID=A0ACB9SDS2_9MYRT|nr:hypothetical protein MLD38_000544 [Melastoma candidum]